MGACVSTAVIAQQLALQPGPVLTMSSMLNVVTPPAALNTLQSYYNVSTGMFGSYPADFWTSANGIEALVNYINVTGDHTFASDVSNTFSAVAGEYFASGYFDDQLWYANAWIREYEVSKDGAYLAQANAIVEAMLEKHDAWTPTCGGGVNWGIGHDYKNTITNVLFGLACAKLYAYGLPGAAGRGYDAWAQDTWDWLEAVRMVADNGLLVDGLNSTCAPTGAFWTYNQGIYTRFAVEMHLHTHQDSFLAAAQRTALSSISYFSDGTPQMTLVEKSCGDNSCGHDGIQFKGVFARQVGYTAQALANGSTTQLGYYQAWLANNTATMCTSDSKAVDSSHIAFGEWWQGPFVASAFPNVAVGSAVDLLNACSSVGPMSRDVVASALAYAASRAK